MRSLTVVAPFLALALGCGARALAPDGITVGWFTEEFDPGGCDAKSSTAMAGVRLL